MRTLTALILLLVHAQAASAHGNEPHGSGLPWTFDAWIVLPVSISGVLYAMGSLRLWQRSQKPAKIMLRSALLFWTGLLTLFLALTSSLHFMGERLFTFHMIEHEIVMAVAAPLLVLARPIGMLLWGLPTRIRRVFGQALKSKPVREAWDMVSRGSSATVLHGLAIWAWHAPVLFDATVTNVAVHRLQHLSFFLTAIIFWWSVIWRCSRGLGAWHLFVTMLHTSVLGALIALAPNPVYLAQTRMALEWGLTPLEDQQLAGIIMWVPGGIIYAAAALWMLAVWIHGASRRGVHEHRYHPL
jgi:cytochrome c oxidase assembly factor CtaG